MALIKKCDRCGKIYDHYGLPSNTDDKKENNIAANGISFIYWLFGKSSYKNITGYDLCPDCLEQLKKWLFDQNYIVVSKNSTAPFCFDPVLNPNYNKEIIDKLNKNALEKAVKGIDAIDTAKTCLNILKNKFEKEEKDKNK